MVEVMVTSLMDQFYKDVVNIFKKKELFILAICFVALLLGIPCVMQVTHTLNFYPYKKKRSFLSLPFCPKECASVQVGIYVFQLMDHYTAIVSIMFLAFFEVMAICWIYGEEAVSLLHASNDAALFCILTHFMAVCSI